MASVTSLGTGSGIDLETLVTKLMAAESAPLTRLKTKQTAFQTKISSLGKLSSALSSLQTAATNMSAKVSQTATDKFATYSATVANTAVASASASTGAVAGNYSLEVSKLASSQQIKSSAFASSTTVVSTTAGTLSIGFGKATAPFTANSTLSIDIAANATLQDVRDAINAKAGGVSATIVNGTSGAQLVLTGPEGESNAMKLSGITGLAYDPTSGTAQDFTQTTAASNATFKLNGIDVSSASNKVTTALDGVTLQLTATNVGTPTTVTVGQEVSTQVNKLLQEFITAYNSANTTMKSLGSYNASTKTAGDLQGNSTLRSATASLRSQIFETTSGNASSKYQTLSSIGVTLDATGALSIEKPEKLTAALAAEPTVVASLIDKVGKAIDTAIKGLTGTDGSVTNATAGLNKSVAAVTKQQENMQTRLVTIEARYRAQFTAMDTMVSSLNTSSTYLTNYITSLNSSKN